jgi:hypothetical protein
MMTGIGALVSSIIRAKLARARKQHDLRDAAHKIEQFERAHVRMFVHALVFE